MKLLCFFCKQKKAYDTRISDWSSDVCSSDLSIAVSLKTRRQVTLRGVIENGQKIVKCTRQKVTEQLPLSQESQQQRRIGAVLLPAFNDSDQAQNARIVCVFILVSS